MMDCILKKEKRPVAKPMIVSNGRRIGSHRLAHSTLQFFFSSSHANDVHHAAAAAASAGKAINLY